MTSTTNTAPLYHQVLDEIRRRVTEGEWVRGERVPSERQLAELLDVSRITVRHAVRLAVAEGLVEQRRGVGTFVGSPERVEQDLSAVRSFELTLAEQGYVASTEILEVGTLISDLTLAGILRTDPATPVHNLRLLGRGDSTPVVYYDSYFTPALGREMVRVAHELRDRGQAFSTLDLYRQGSFERVPTMLSQTIDAVLASADLVEHLGVPEGAAILAIESVMSDDEGPLEFRRAYYRADRYKFAVKRRVSIGATPNS
ncbi:GntR family transcriptional regulator [Ornithinimicrobium faecis]|uniref:GntR family transcriptional regulator n=1 Tax=Ornithinimicrobium faecis TaxID=2934158 RepID=UPI00211987D2|nr:GntR family transcriptional regulator [Ornithinimicrobium sp. HY1745]